MKYFIFYLFVISLLFQACQKEDIGKDEIQKDEENVEVEPAVSKKLVRGNIQKGPFINGSTIFIQELDSNYVPTGKAYTTSTTNDFGEYSMKMELESDKIEVMSQGFYYNEVKGQISEANLTLRAIAYQDDSTLTNINILTTIAQKRILHLIKEENLSFKDAKEKAEREVLDIFLIPEIDSLDFNKLDIRKEGDENAILLAISCILQGELSVGELSELISKIISDIEVDGILDSEENKNQLYVNADNLILSKIRSNLENRYKSLGVEIIIPNFEKYAKRLIPLIIRKTAPIDGSNDILFSLDKVSVEFNKAIDISSLSNETFKVTNSAGQIVGGEFYYDKDSFKIDFVVGELLPDQKYQIMITSGLVGIDEDLIEAGYSFSFSTLGIDIESNLILHYTFSGNLEDNSGNNYTAFGNNIFLTKDKFGNSGQAYNFPEKGSYLETPVLDFNLNEKYWTYMIWFKVNEFPTNTFPILFGTEFTSGGWKDAPMYIKADTKRLRTYMGDKMEVNTDLEVGIWYHGTVVMDDGYISLYLNGIGNNYNPEFFTGEKKEYFDSYNGKFYISQKYRWDDDAQFIGDVDNVRLYRRALNKYEIQEIYESEK